MNIKQRGFNLIELSIVMIIIVVVSGSVFHLNKQQLLNWQIKRAKLAMIHVATKVNLLSIPEQLDTNLSFVPFGTDYLFVGEVNDKQFRNRLVLRFLTDSHSYIVYLLSSAQDDLPYMELDDEEQLNVDLDGDGILQRDELNWAGT